MQATTKPESIILNGTNADMPEVGKMFSLSDRSYLVPALSKGYVDAIAAHETSVLQYEKDYGVDLRVLYESLLDGDWAAHLTLTTSAASPRRCKARLTTLRCRRHHGVHPQALFGRPQPVF